MQETSLKIALLGLADSVAAELVKCLARQKLNVYSLPCFTAADCLTLIEKVGPDLVFCDGDQGPYKQLLDALRHKDPTLPIVLVSRCAEPAEWVRALELGASDYCSPPFETVQVQWILETALKSRTIKGCGRLPETRDLPLASHSPA